MNTNTVIKINKEHNKKEFVRNVAIYLASTDSTPVDILDSELYNIKEETTEYLLVSGDTSVEYSCSVGYDRQETYYDGDTRRTRTVTDWRPHSGSNRSEEFAIVGNADNQDDYRRSFIVECFYQNCKPELKDFLNQEMEINDNAYDCAVEKNIAQCFNSVKLPGNRQKDKNYSGTFTATDIIGLQIPEYSATYDYQGQQYTAKGFAANPTLPTATTPSIMEDLDKSTVKSVAIFKWLSIFSLIFGIILNILAEDIGGWHWAAYGAALLFVILYFVLIYAIESSVIAKNQEQKKRNLVEFLQKNNMRPLTESELEEFKRSK